MCGLRRRPYVRNREWVNTDRTRLDEGTNAIESTNLNHAVPVNMYPTQMLFHYPPVLDYHWSIGAIATRSELEWYRGGGGEDPTRRGSGLGRKHWYHRHSDGTANT